MNFEIAKHLILLVKAGSHAYGINTETSDLDIKGIVMPPISNFVGLDRFESCDSDTEIEKLKGLMDESTLKAAENGLEGVVYEFRKFLGLAERCNANVLDLLFCRDEDIIFINKYGQMLRDNRDLFISAAAHGSFAGYAVGQVKLMERRKDKPNPNAVRAALEEKHGYDSKHAGHAVRLLRMGKEILTEGKVEIYRSDREELLGIRNGSMSYQGILDYTSSLVKELDLIMDNKSFVIPANPRHDEINALCQNIVLEYIDEVRTMG